MTDEIMISGVDMIRRLEPVRQWEIEEVLGEGFVFNSHVSKEFAYDRKGLLVTIRVYSSIPRMENFREEFIRVCMLHGTSERLMTWFRVPRDKRWKENLRNRLVQIGEESNIVRHCTCGGLLHVKRGPFGRFLACTKCRYRDNVLPVLRYCKSLPSPQHSGPDNVGYKRNSGDHDASN